MRRGENKRFIPASFLDATFSNLLRSSLSARLREEKEIQRVHFVKTQAREKMKAEERQKKLKAREQRDWILKRRQELIVNELREKKNEENEEKERKRVFNKYQVKLQNKVARERKEREAAWKKREVNEEKVRRTR